MGRMPLSDDDGRVAVVELLDALARGDALEVIVANAQARHPKHDTFPGEVFLKVACDALDVADASRAAPIAYEGFVDTHLADWTFRGRERAKIQFAVLAAAAGCGGMEADLLGKTYWWNSDDFWRYGLLAAVGCLRAAASRKTLPVSIICDEVLTRWA